MNVKGIVGSTLAVSFVQSLVMIVQGIVFCHDIFKHVMTEHSTEKCLLLKRMHTNSIQDTVKVYVCIISIVNSINNDCYVIIVSHLCYEHTY